MSQTTQTVAEVVTFRLVSGSNPADFVQAASALEPMLKASQDVLSRVLSQDADGLWTDHITWTSMTAAKTMAEKMMADPMAAPMMGMIDPETVTMRHAEILYQQE